jgi:putative flippase GtrA
VTDPLATTARQAGRFLVSGLVATGADLATYAALIRAGIPGGPTAAKAGSFLVGTTVAYLLARAWTFAGSEARSGRGTAFLVLYTFAFGLNVGVHAFTMRVAAGLAPYTPHVAFVAATGTAMVWNFLGQKFVVFREGPA